MQQIDSSGLVDSRFSSDEVAQLEVSGGIFTIVDKDIYAELRKYQWSLHKKPCGYVHVYRYEKRTDGIYPSPYRRIRLTHQIMGSPPPKMGWDHINGNTLDNRRKNLRLSTQRQNLQNARVRRIKDRPLKPKTSKYKGVSKAYTHGKDSLTKPWRARIRIDGKLFALGWFSNEEDAALAYNESALKNFGEFASLNEIEATK